MEKTEKERAAKAGEPTILEAHQVAITYDEENGYQILLPSTDEHDEMPQGAAVLVATAMRLTDDEAFYQEMVAWLEARQDILRN